MTDKNIEIPKGNEVPNTPSETKGSSSEKPIVHETRTQLAPILKKETQERLLNESRQRLMRIRSVLGMPEGAYDGGEIVYLAKIDPEGMLATFKPENFTDDPEDCPSDDAFAYGGKKESAAEKREHAVWGMASAIRGREGTEAFPTTNVPELRNAASKLRGHEWLRQVSLEGKLRMDHETAIHELKEICSTRELDDTESYALLRSCNANPQLVADLQKEMPELFHVVMAKYARNIHFNNLETVPYDSMDEYWEQHDCLKEEGNETYHSGGAFRNLVGKMTYSGNIDSNQMSAYLRYFKRHPDRLHADDIAEVMGHLMLWIKHFDTAEIPKDVLSFLKHILTEPAYMSETRRWNAYLDYRDDDGNLIDPDSLIHMYSISNKELEPLTKTMEESGISDPVWMLRDGGLKYENAEFLRLAAEWWKSISLKKAISPERAACSLIDFLNARAPDRVLQFYRENRKEKGAPIPTHPIPNRILFFVWTLTHKNVPNFRERFQYVDIGPHLLRSQNTIGSDDVSRQTVDAVLLASRPSCKDLWEAIYASKEYETNPGFWIKERHQGSPLYDRLLYEDTERVCRFIEDECLDGGYGSRGVATHNLMEILADLAKYDVDRVMDLFEKVVERRPDFAKDLRNSSHTWTLSFIPQIAYAPVFHSKEKVSALADHDHLEEDVGLRVAHARGQESIETRQQQLLLHMMGFLERHEHAATGVSAFAQPVPVGNPEKLAHDLVSFLGSKGEEFFVEAAKVRQKKREQTPAKDVVRKLINEMLQKLRESAQNNPSWGQRSPMPPTKNQPSEHPDLMARLSKVPKGDGAYLRTTLFDAYDPTICSHLPANSRETETLLSAIAKNRPATEMEKITIQLFHVVDGCEMPIPHGAVVVDGTFRCNLPKASLLQNPDGTYRLQAGNIPDQDGSAIFDVLVPVSDPEPGNQSIEEVQAGIRSLLGQTRKERRWWQIFSSKEEESQPLKNLLTPLTSEKELPEDLLKIVRKARNAASAREAVTMLRSAVHTFAYDLSIIDDPEHLDLLKGIPYEASEGNKYLQLLYKRRSGICGDLSSVFTDLLRHTGIPAYEAKGAVAGARDISGNDLHAWVSPILLDGEGKLFVDVEEATSGGMSTVLAAIRKKFERTPEMKSTPPSALLEWSEELDPERQKLDSGQEKSDPMQKKELPEMHRGHAPSDIWAEYWAKTYEEFGIAELAKNAKEAEEAFNLALALHRLSLNTVHSPLDAKELSAALPEAMASVRHTGRVWRGAVSCLDMFAYLTSTLAQRYLHMYLEQDGGSTLSANQRNALLRACKIANESK